MTIAIQTKHCIIIIVEKEIDFFLKNLAEKISWKVEKFKKFSPLSRMMLKNSPKKIEKKKPSGNQGDKNWVNHRLNIFTLHPCWNRQKQ